MPTAPFEPDPEFPRDRTAAADPGQGAPEQEPGFGADFEESDVIVPPGEEIEGTGDGR